MTEYNKIKSKFIRDKIKNCKWGKKKYIDDLIKIEEFALGQSFGLMTSYVYKHLTENYPTEWKIIHLEIDPKGYKDGLKREKKEALWFKKIDAEDKRAERREKEQDKKDWEKMGGKL